MHLVDSLTETDKSLLEQSIVFNGITSNDLQPFFNHCQVRTYHAGQNILTIGDSGEGLFIILDGRIEVYIPQKNHNNSKLRINIMEVGKCFGEYSLVDHKTVSASVGAFTSTRLFLLPTEDFYRIAEADMKIENIIYKNIMKLLITRCRETNQELEDDAFLIY